MRRADSLLFVAFFTSTWLLVVCLEASACGAEPEDPTRFAADRPLDSLHIRLDLDVDVEKRYVKGTATIDLAALRPVSRVTLDAVDFSISAVHLSRANEPPVPVRFTHDGKKLEVPLEGGLETGETLQLVVEYAVHDPASGLHFFGPSPEAPDIPHVVWSQGEATFNSYWFPCFDHPGERQTTELIVTTKRGYEVSSNGRLVSRKEDPERGTVTVHWRQDRPHATYLVSLIVGEFHVTRSTWREKPVEFWVHPGHEADVERTFRNTIRMLDFFSDRIGVVYPWDRYAQICCEGFGGGMENTSATTLGTRALHDERSFIDSNSDGLIAHELAHQWWGDLLTCRDWAHLWLNEGFASYFEALWTEHDLGQDEFAYNMYGKGRAARGGGTRRPIVDRAYASPHSMFDSRAYPKGAWVLHMIRRRLGDDLFWKVLNHYATSHAYECVETVDLRKTIEKVTGRTFERFFYDWTARPGHPELSVGFEWLGDEELARIDLKQTQETPAFHFPLTVEFRFAGDRPPTSFTRSVAEKEVTLYLPLAERPSLLRIDPDQTVLMELKENKGRDLWEAQLRQDPSVVLRIQAARHFGASRSDADRQLLAEALRKETFWGVRSEIAAALGETGGDIARDALIEGLKCEHPKVRAACVAALRSFRRDPLVVEAVRPLVVGGDPSYRVEAAAIETYALGAPADALEVLATVLSRDSRGEVIRSAALRGLGRLQDSVVVGLLCEWTRLGRPRQCRTAAIGTLARWTTRTRVDDSTMGRVVETLAAALDATTWRVRWAAVRALGTLSEPAKARPALPALEALEAGDPEERVRDAAKSTIQAIESGKPAQVQVTELREQLKEALEQNRDLEERIEKLEARLKAD